MEIATQGKNDSRRNTAGLVVLALAMLMYGFNSSGSTASLGTLPAVQQTESELNQVQKKSPVLTIQTQEPEVIRPIVPVQQPRVQYEVKKGDTKWKISRKVKPANVQLNDYVKIIEALNKNASFNPGTSIHLPHPKDLAKVSLPTVDIHFELTNPELLLSIKEAEGTIQLQSTTKRKLLNGRYDYSFRNGKFYPYQDSHGNWSIGYGRLLGKPNESHKARVYAKGISVYQANEFLRLDMERSYNDFVLMLRKKKATSLPHPVQLALFEMTFNMGSGKVNDFNRMWKSLNKGNYLKASKEMKNSLWAKQVGNRAQRIVAMVAASHEDNTI